MMIFPRVLLLIIVVFVFFSCGDKNEIKLSPEELKVKELETEITTVSKGAYTVSEMDSLRKELVTALDNLYKAEIADTISAKALDKLHLTYSAMHDYVKAAHIADTLINNFPEYPNREMVIESQANNYDMFIIPRNRNKVKYYLELLLKEYPEMSPERRKEFEFRLENVDLTMEELILKRAAQGEQ